MKVFRTIENFIYFRSQRVCNQYLFGKSPYHQPQAINCLVVVEYAWFNQLGQQVSGTFNRTSNQEREITDKHTIIHPVSGRFYPLVVDVYHIGKTVECVKGDPHGQNDLERPGICFQSKIRQHPGERVNEEVVIFEESKESKVGTYTDPQPDFPDAFIFRIRDQYAGRVVKSG